MTLPSPSTHSYADMLRNVKTAVHEKNLSYDISTRRAKSGNIILKITNRDQVDNLAAIIEAKMRDSVGIRCQSLSVPLLFMGINDSIGVSELKEILVAFDGELKSMNNSTIREGKDGVRSTVIRVPLKVRLRLLDTKRIK